MKSFKPKLTAQQRIEANADRDIGFAMGTSAFVAGLKCVPAHDARVAPHLRGRQVGDHRTVPFLEGWISGWTRANLDTTSGAA